MRQRNREQGMTLVVALVMLAVLTMMVASAIRFGNINLKITGNAQSETEANAAALVGLETMVQAVAAALNINSLAGETRNVSTGAMNYSVVIPKPACMFNKPVTTDQLDPSNPKDLACYEQPTGEPIRDAVGNLVYPASGCKDQQWDVQASVNDTNSGAKTSLLQGVSVRVGPEVACP
jgi:hypothetical protein